MSTRTEVIAAAGLISSGRPAGLRETLLSGRLQKNPSTPRKLQKGGREAQTALLASARSAGLDQSAAVAGSDHQDDSPHSNFEDPSRRPFQTRRWRHPNAHGGGQYNLPP